MDEKELLALADKIKAGNATKDEITTFQKELSKLLSEMEGLLKE